MDVRHFIYSVSLARRFARAYCSTVVASGCSVLWLRCSSHRKVYSNVALDAGFDSHESFSRAFKLCFRYRQESFASNKEVAFNHFVRHYQLHVEVAFRAAPCVGLYRVSIRNQSKSHELVEGENVDMSTGLCPARGKTLEV